MKITYTAVQSASQGWAGVYWQNSENNWGSKAGVDLTGATQLTFWAKGAAGGENVEFKAGGITGDSAAASLGKVTLTDQWKEYTIDLAGKNLSNIVGGFCFVAAAKDNPTGFTMYLDNINYK